MCVNFSKSSAWKYVPISISDQYISISVRYVTNSISTSNRDFTVFSDDKRFGYCVIYHNRAQNRQPKDRNKMTQNV